MASSNIVNPNMVNANTDALANLKPLIAPPAIAWWPPAPGWWILGTLLLLGLVALSIYSWKRVRLHQRTRYQREALALLDNVNTLEGIAQLIRRAAISALGREHAATADWNTLCPTFDPDSLQLLNESLYRNDTATPESIAHLRLQTQQWLRTLPPVR
ncbi:MAG TPA: DUF4381 domain-containing protein [Pseudomonadales bacterium]|nr:DUF4381 domain-containing protein [Pseudomonadales bacterium]